MVDIPVRLNCLSVLRRYDGNVAKFCKETRYHLFGSTSVSFEFHMWVLIWEDPHCLLLLRLGVVLVYPGFDSCCDVPNARRPYSVKFSYMRVCQPTLPRFCSSLRLWGSQRLQRFLTPRQSCRMRVRLPDEIFMISCISAHVILGSFLIRDSIVETFLG